MRRPSSVRSRSRRTTDNREQISMFFLIRRLSSVVSPLAALIFAACISATAAAQTYPDHPITMIVPFPPGGATDALARIIQEPMQNSRGQPIVVETVGGAGGMLAGDKAARANPDGYTILIHQVALAAGMALYQNLNFDAEKNFVTKIGRAHV